MNRTIARALLLDAWRQVLDNWVFRLLVVLSAVLILPTFVVGFREDGVHVLFGWKHFSYDELFGRFGGGGLPTTEDLHIKAIQNVQEVLVQGLAGTVGIFFCIAATAFFLPRMLEKGAADILFSKPLSRTVLLLSRYATGVLFVAVLAFVLVFGIHLGLLVTSGYSDPGFLWGAVTLVYVYALVQGFSIVVAVFTRNSVATILCTLIFYTFNGCIQGVWVVKESTADRQRAMAKHEDPEDPPPIKDEQPLLSFLELTLDTLHYVLPKTNDASVLTKKLRTIVVGRTVALEDEAGDLAIERHPQGFTIESGGGKVDLASSPASWVADRESGSGSERWTLSRRSRMRESAASREKDEKPRMVRESAAQAARDFLKSIESKRAGSPDPTRESEVYGTNRVEFVRWSEDSAKGRVDRERAFFTNGDWMYELDVVADGSGIGAEQRRRSARRFLAGAHPVQETYDPSIPGASYEATFGWTAPLKYNAFFSIFSSLAFVVAMLLLACWRIHRIDF